MNDEHNETPSVVVTKTSNNDRQRFKLPKISKKRVLLFASLLLVTVSVGASLTYLLQDRKSDKITIGDTTITKKDIDTYAQQLQTAREKNTSSVGEDENGNKNPRVTAVNVLVLNAALKHEAKLAGVTVSRNDIASAFGGPAASADYTTASSTMVGRINFENEAYRSKLADKLLAKKDLLYAYIIADSPYFHNVPEKKLQGAYDQAKARLNKDILPLLKSGKTKEEVAKKADVVVFDEKNPNNSNWQQYYDKAVLSLDVMEGYLPGEGFNDMPFDSYRGNPGKRVDTDKKLAELKNVGDTTDVFLSKAGTYMVARLEAKTNGKYASWDTLLQTYKDEYAVEETNFLTAARQAYRSVANAAAKGALKLADTAVLAVMSIGQEKASALVCSDHRVAFKLIAINQYDGERLTGAQVQHVRNAAHPCGSQYTGTHTLTSGSSDTYWDNCFGAEPDWRAGGPAPWQSNDPSNDGPTRHPSGFTDADFRGLQWEDNGVWRPGFPDWVPGAINSNTGGVIKIQLLYYKKPPDGTWNLNTSSYVQRYFGSESLDDQNNSWAKAETIYAKPGDEVFFLHAVKNTNTSTENATNFNRWRQSRTIDANGNPVVGPGTDAEGWGGQQAPTNTASLAPGSRIQTPAQVYNSSGYQRSFTVPSGVPAGTTYCQRYAAQPSAKLPSGVIDNSVAYSNEACVTVSFWTVEPRSSALNPGSQPVDYVEQGGSVSFNHTYQNTGNTYVIYQDPPGGPLKYPRVWPEANYDPGNPLDPNSAWRTSGPDVAPLDIAFMSPGEVNTYPGGALTAPNTAQLGRSYCQRLNVLPWTSLDFNAQRTSTPACAVVVGGKTSVSAGATPGMVEPGESASLTIDLNTNSFTSYGSWTGYNANCSYTVITYVYGGGTSSSGGSCSRFIGSNNPVTITNNPNTNLPIGSRVCVTATLSSAAGPSGVANNNLLAAGGPTTTPEYCVMIVAKPYLRVYGSDVAVGQGFGGAACNTNSSIIAWNRGSGANYGGAGVQFAAFAQKQIRYFAAGQGLPAGDSQYGYAPTRLGFANVNINVPLGHFGGDFNGLGCGMTDYYGSKPPTTTNWTSLSAANGVGDSIFSYTGNLRLEGSAEDSANIVENGSNIKLYVNGNVYITSNITAETGATAAGDIPGFTLIASGNIYISPSVSRLYGTYVAQPNAGSGGNIYTCATAAGTNFTALNPMSSGNPNNDYNTCRTRLVVVGSFVAKKVNLLRTFGTRIQDNGNGIVSIGPGYNNAAEVFHYNPLTWLRQSTTSSSSSDTTYDSITTLPPVL